MLHITITILILFGTCLFWPWPSLLLAHMAFNALVMLQWLVNDNRCILSYEYEDDAGYSKDLIKRVTGREVTTQTADTIAHVLTLLAIATSASVYLKTKC